MEQMRLDKFLTQTAGLTRSEAKQYLKKGRVCVDGAVVKKPETKIDADTAEVTVDERTVIMKNIRISCSISRRESSRPRRTGESARCSTSSESLPGDCFLWDGWTKIRKDCCCSPMTENWHMRCYRPESMWRSVICASRRPGGKKRAGGFCRRLDIGDEKKTLPARLLPAQDARAEQDAQAENADESGDSLRGFGVYITVCEGRFHQVKRMARAVGRKVLYLKRISMGSLRLDESLAPGEYRPLTEDELQGLKRGKTDRK